MSAAIAAELRAAMRHRRTTPGAVAAAVGSGHAAVYRIRSGLTVPTMDHAVAIAEHLDWPRFAEVVREARTKRCVVCDAPFVDRGRNGTARTCSRRCMGTRYQRQVRGVAEVRAVGDVRVVRTRLTMYQDAVAAMCHDCTLGEGLCRQPGCQLRDVSPLPLARVRVA